MKVYVIIFICSFLVVALHGSYIAKASDTDVERTLAIVNDAVKLIDSNPDSALVLLKDVYTQSLELRNDSLQMIAYYLISQAYDNSKNYHLAIEYSFKALEILEKTSLNDMHTRQLLMLFTLYNRLGYAWFHLDSKEPARRYLLRVMNLVETVEAIKPGVYSDQLIAYTLSNFGAAYLDMGELELARNAFNLAAAKNSKLNDTILGIGLFINWGIYYKEKSVLDSSLYFYHQALPLAEVIDDKAFISKVHNNLGNLMKLKGNESEVSRHFRIALNTASEIHAWNSVIIAAKALSEINAAKGDYKKAWELNALVIHLNDSIFSPSRNEQYSRMALQYDFDKELRVHQAELTARWKDQRNQKLMFFFLSIMLSLVVIIVVIVLLALKRRARYERLQKDYIALNAQRLASEKEEMKSELEMKNRHLMEKAMWLSQKNEFILQIAHQLADITEVLPEKCGNQLYQIINQLKNDSGENFQKEFETRFNEVHSDFIQKLSQKFPGLSPAERKLASFLRLNLSTKEIASLTYQNPDSIRVARSRLRTKLELAKSDNLIAFLQSF
jgi:tetratricopeptide (TPR) repeat protein